MRPGLSTYSWSILFIAAFPLEGTEASSESRIDDVNRQNRVRQCYCCLMFTALGNRYKLFL